MKQSCFFKLFNRVQLESDDVEEFSNIRIANSIASEVVSVIYNRSRNNGQLVRNVLPVIVLSATQNNRR